jgi:hypothetical protein
MIEKVKLTSVNIIDEVYKKFKTVTVNDEINLQKLVNRSLDLYNNDDQFREKINNYTNLKNRSSKF